LVIFQIPIKFKEPKNQKMKKLLLSLSAVVVLATACQQPKAPESQAGVYKMESSNVKGGNTDSTYANPHQLKIYNASHYFYVAMSDDSTVSFGLGSYKQEGANITETNIYNTGSLDTAADFKLTVVKTDKGYTQNIPEIVVNGSKYALTETYAAVAATGTSDLDGVWKQTANYTMKGKDSSSTPGVQFKIYHAGHFIFAHRYPTDATNTVFKKGFGSGTFTYANGVAEETNDFSNYPSVIGVKYTLKIVFNGKDEFTQTITDEKTGNYTVETYKRL
jgi:hypothetical protein